MSQKREQPYLSSKLTGYKAPIFRCRWAPKNAKFRTTDEILETHSPNRPAKVRLGL